jgi:hypothetical protein
MKKPIYDLLPGDVVCDFYTRYVPKVVLNTYPHRLTRESTVLELADNNPPKVTMPNTTHFDIASLGWQSVAHALWDAWLEQPDIAAAPFGLADMLLLIVGDAARNVPRRDNPAADTTALANLLRATANKLDNEGKNL